MKKSFVVGAVAINALISSLGHAGTMGPVETGHNWTGLYAGANIGGIWAQFSSPLIIDTGFGPGEVFGPNVQSYDADDSSFTGGIQAGYNWQLNHWVVGAEVNVNAERLKAIDILTAAEIPSTSNFVADDYYAARNTWQGSALARLGYAMDNWLFYATGGVAVSNVKLEGDFIATVSGGIAFPRAFGSSIHTLVGGTYGLGIEYALNANWRVGVEGRYTDYATQRYDFGLVPVGNIAPSIFVYQPGYASNLHMTSGQALFKINYQFA